MRNMLRVGCFVPQQGRALMTKTAQQAFLDAYQKEHAITMRVLRAFPPEKKDLTPHPKCKSARELAWVFVLERGLGNRVMTNTLNPGGKAPEAPESFEAIITELEKAQREYVEMLQNFSDDEMKENITF